jgi:hypothetical protein
MPRAAPSSIGALLHWNPRPQLRSDPQHYLIGQFAVVFHGMHSDSAAFSGNAPEFKRALTIAD